MKETDKRLQNLTAKAKMSAVRWESETADETVWLPLNRKYRASYSRWIKLNIRYEIIGIRYAGTEPLCLLIPSHRLCL
jgi:hypothetical protein